MGAVIATMISYFVVWLIITYDTNKAMNLSLNISRIVISVILLCVQWWLQRFVNKVSGKLYEVVRIKYLLFEKFCLMIGEKKDNR